MIFVEAPTLRHGHGNKHNQNNNNSNSNTATGNLKTHKPQSHHLFPYDLVLASRAKLIPLTPSTACPAKMGTVPPAVGAAIDPSVEIATSASIKVISSHQISDGADQVRLKVRPRAEEGPYLSRCLGDQVKTAMAANGRQGGRQRSHCRLMASSSVNE